MTPIAPALLLAAAFVMAPFGAARAEPRPDPANAAASVPALKYESPLAGYRASADDRPMPWQQANDTTARIGGWRAYAREAREPTPGASAASAGHQSHGIK